MNTDSVLVDVAVKDLSGAALDWAVAKALGYADYPDDSVEQGAWWYTDPVKAPFSERIRKADWKPSTDWRQGGPLIEKYGLRIDPPIHGGDGQWAGVFFTDPEDHDEEFTHYEIDGPTPLVAACRALVEAKLGDIVKVPALLVLS